MRVLAIDPGPSESAWLVYDSDREIIGSFGIGTNERCMDTVRETPCEFVACEMVACFGMAVGREVFDTCVWIGQFWHQANASGKPFHKVYRLDVKTHLCHNARAKDSNIRRALLDRLGKEKCAGIKTHLWSALAIAVTFADREENWNK